MPADRPFGRLFPLLFAAAFAGCGAPAAARHPDAPPAPVNGPAADYPVVVGEPYTAGGVSFTPEDKLNSDEVGYAALDPKGGNAITGEHHTLPLPSYVEVTSLETGKTILVRLERRGPMDGSQLIGLSAGALDQLGASAGTPVRVRRVNPPEEERALLRAGSRAPARIDTPMSLVNVLRRKLPGGEGQAAAASTDLTAKSPPSSVAVPASTAGASPPTPKAAAAGAPPPLPPLEPAAAATDSPRPATVDIGKPGREDFPWIASPQPAQPSRPGQAQPKPGAPAKAPAAGPAPATAVAAGDGFVVQAGAFSTRQRAQGVAKAIGGSVSSSGKLFRVRTGPFGSKREAEASLAKVRAAGYSDARIYSSG